MTGVVSLELPDQLAPDVVVRRIEVGLAAEAPCPDPAGSPLPWHLSQLPAPIGSIEVGSFVLRAAHRPSLTMTVASTDIVALPPP
jgi:hypothetical protein